MNNNKAEFAFFNPKATAFPFSKFLSIVINSTPSFLETSSSAIFRDLSIELSFIKMISSLIFVDINFVTELYKVSSSLKELRQINFSL